MTKTSKTENVRFFIEEIQIEDFLNHTLTTIPLCPQLNILIGPNGVGKSAVLDSIIFLNEKNSNRSRYKSWREFFPKGKGSVQIKISTVDAEINDIFKKEYNNGRAKYRINGKIVKFKEFNEELSERNIKLSPLTIVPQGTVADKIRKLNPSEMRSYLELLTQASEELKIFELKNEKFEKSKEKLNEMVLMAGHKEITLKALEEEYNEILKFKRLKDRLSILESERIFARIDQLSQTIDLLEETITKRQNKIRKITKKENHLKQKEEKVKSYEQKLQVEIDLLKKEENNLIGKKSIAEFNIRE